VIAGADLGRVLLTVPADGGLFAETAALAGDSDDLDMAQEAVEGIRHEP
jgi:hypothetical protein